MFEFDFNLRGTIEAANKGLDLYKESKYNCQSPLETALKLNKLEVVDCLIRRGVDVNRPLTRSYYTASNPLMETLSTISTSTLELLLSCGADPNVIDTRTKRTPLTTCLTCNRSFKHLKLLVKHGADVNQADGYGEYPLLLAVKKRCLGAIKYLLDEGAEFTAQGALHEAIKIEDLEIVRLLLERGIGVNFHCWEDHIPLTCAAATGNVEIVKELIEKGAEVNLMDGEGRLPLVLAVNTRKLNLVSLLVENGADVNKTDGDGNFPLVKAMDLRHQYLVKFFLENGANCEVFDQSGYTPLTRAVEMLNFELVRFLVERGLDLDKIDNGGRRALDMAVEKKNLRMVKFLTEKGANISEEAMAKIEEIKRDGNWAFFLQELTGAKRRRTVQ